MAAAAPVRVEVRHALEQRVAAECFLDFRVRVAVGNHPQVFAGVHVDRGDAADRSLEEVRDAGQRIVGDDRRRRFLTARRDPRGQRLAGHLVVVAFGCRRQQRRRAAARGRDEDHARARIGCRGPRDVRAATAAGADVRRALALLVAAMRRRGKQGREQIEFPRALERQLPDLRRVVDQVRLGAALEVVRRGLGHVRLRPRELFFRHERRGRRAIDDRPDRFARVPVVRIHPRLFRDLEEARNAPAIDVHVEQHRRGWRVVVPDVVLDELLVPDAFARLHVQRDDAGAEQVVAGAEAAEVVDGGAVGRHVDEAALRIRRHRRPRRHVAGPLPRVVFPRVVAKLTRPRNHVELPQELPGLRVVGQDVPGHVFDAGLVVTLFGRVADDQHVVDDNRRRRCGDVAERQRQAVGRIVGLLGVDPRLPVGDQVLEHVDRARFREAAYRYRGAEPFDRLARLRIERVQEEPRRGHVDDATAVDPRVGHALAVVRAHRVRMTRRLGLLERPQGLAAHRIERDDRAARARRRQQHAVHVDRQRARVDVADFDARRHLAAPIPRHLQRVEVRRVDLVERCVAG